MEKQDIKNLLGSVQEEALATAASRQMRAWSRLQDALWGEVSYSTSSAHGSWTSLLLTYGAVAAIAVAVGLAAFLPTINSSGQQYAHAHQPDIYASTFYSAQAQADVVWITGLQSADETETTP